MFSHSLKSDSKSQGLVHLENTIGIKDILNFTVLPNCVGDRKPHSYVRLFAFMDFYVYILESEVDGSYYKGVSSDPVLRLQHHNAGESFYTRNKKPWKLIYVEIYSQKKQALIREKALKKYSHKQLQQLFASPKNQLNNYLYNK